MMKKLTTVLAFAMLFAFTAKAQWTSAGPWPDDTHKGGTHGIEVTPDGNIWTASYYKTQWITPDGDTLLVSPILVFSADGSSIDTIYTVTTGSVIDTLGYNPASGSSGTRSLAKDDDGNIYFTRSTPNRIVKINYQTHEGMARHDITEVGSSPIAGGVSSDGTVFVGPVVGGGTSAIVKYDADLNYVENAVDAPPFIARYFEVSDDGNTIYWTTFTGTQGMFIFSRADEFSSYELVDSALQGMSIETARWNPGTGLLWVSNDSRGLNKAYTHLTWYGYDVNAKAIVDSFTLAPPDTVPADEYPRGLAFSADGNVAYVGLFGSKYDRLYKFDKVTGIQQELGVKPDDFSLSQNFPNPFNPSTTIKFNIANPGFVTLKVYDMLGKEVAELVNQDMVAGSYSIAFDASNLASGTYVYQLNVGGVQLSKKMVLLK